MATIWEIFRGHPQNVSLIKFSQNIDGFRQNDWYFVIWNHHYLTAVAPALHIELRCSENFSINHYDNG